MVSLCRYINRSGISENPTIKVISYYFKCSITQGAVSLFYPREAWPHCHAAKHHGPLATWGCLRRMCCVLGHLHAGAMLVVCHALVRLLWRLISRSPQLIGIYWGSAVLWMPWPASHRRERGCPPSSSHLRPIVRISFCNREAKTLEKLNGKDFFPLSNNSVFFFFLITKVIYILSRKFSEIQKSIQTHKLSTISSPRDNTVNILVSCLLISFNVLI